ncbi:uncharacterized protein LOC143883676 [Tasmannia lanceolata]|uniref:uncharacterized protein LOC143883676 n=1 Tax=Tasmannia lanceolata TaxID=3420 RepID=UPI004062B7FA
MQCNGDFQDRVSPLKTPLMATMDHDMGVSIALQNRKPIPETSLLKVEIEKVGRNSRRIRSHIGIGASLETIWKILTDYERLVDFIPGLAVSRLMEKGENYSRIFQVGEQRLPFGLKFNARAILDCYEKDLEPLSSGRKRDLEFEMVEGDFQTFKGKWSIVQVDEKKSKGGGSYEAPDSPTVLSYTIDVVPKRWPPISLVEGRLKNEIEKNLLCIREEANKTFSSPN